MSVVQAAHRFVPAELNDPEWYPFDRESPMYFDVHEYPLHIQSKKDPQRTMSVDGYKALIRKADGERAVPLAVVGDGYKVVQNRWWGLDWSVYLDIQNLYNRQNEQQGRYYIGGDATLQRRPVYGIPIFPSLGFSLSF